MPSIQVTGQLVDPTTGVEGSADIRIASVINYGQTTKKSISHKSTDASGNYDFQLVYGKHLIFVKYEDERIYIPIGYAVVGDSTPDPIDLIQLINLSDENPSSELVTELQKLREDTINDIVDTSAQALENAGYQGEWVSGTSTALKGETWQVDGRYYVALKDTSDDPVNDNDNWREVVSTESVTTAQNDIVGGSIFKGSNGENVENGDIVDPGITHLVAPKGGIRRVVKISPQQSGVITEVSSDYCKIDSIDVDFDDIYVSSIKMHISYILNIDEDLISQLRTRVYTGQLAFYSLTSNAFYYSEVPVNGLVLNISTENFGERVITTDSGAFSIVRVDFLNLRRSNNPVGWGYDGTASTTESFIKWIEENQPLSVVGDYNLGTNGSDTIIPFKKGTNLNSFSANDVNFGSGFVYGKYLNIPSSFPWSPGIYAKALSPGRVELIGWDASNYDFTLDESIEPSVVYYYVDNINGDNNTSDTGAPTYPDNPGTDPASPLRSVSTALNRAEIDGNQYSCILIKGGYYYDVDSWGNVYPSQNLVVKKWVDESSSDPRDNYRVILAAETPNLSWSLSSGNVYVASRSGVNYVVDQRQKDWRGDYIYYERVNSIAECQSLEGSYYKDNSSGLVYVHAIGGDQPDNSYIRCYLSKANGGCGDGTYTLYVEGVTFLGGTASWDGNSRPAGTNETVVLKDVTAKYSSSNLFQSYGVALFITQDCKGAHALSDGFNIHSNRGTTPGAPDTLTQVCYYIEINSETWDIGKTYGLNADSNNGTTVHENNIAIRLGGIHHDSQGPVVADVQGAQTYNFCVTGLESTRVAETPRKTSFLISGSDGGQMWLDNCVGKKSLYSLDAYGGGKMYVEDIEIDSAIEGIENIYPITRS